MTGEEHSGWVATRRQNLFLLTEHSMSKKAFAMNLNKEFSIVNRGKRIVLGELLRVDLSPEALVEALDIREGDKVLVLPAGSRGRAVAAQRVHNP